MDACYFQRSSTSGVAMTGLIYEQMSAWKVELLKSVVGADFPWVDLMGLTHFEAYKYLKTRIEQ